MSELLEAVARFEPGRILVYGDLMLDEYLFGRADRLSPEKPVPVVAFERRDAYLGGAGNVARNLQALGCEPVLVATVGDDETGEECRARMGELGMTDDGLVAAPGRATPRKLRVNAGQHALVRIDYEAPDGTTREADPARGEIEARLGSLARDARAAIVSDYRKGTVFRTGVAALAETLGSRPLVADPKGSDAERYRGASFLVPNEREIADLLGAAWSDPDVEGLRRHLGLRVVALTRSDRGVRLFEGGRPEDVPARARAVFDVTGAGDTFAAVFAAFVAVGEAPRTAARLANAAAGVKVRKVGTATVSLDELRAELARDEAPSAKRVDRRVAAAWAAERRARGETVVFTNGCFDLLHVGHVRFLEASRVLGDALIVGLNTDGSIRRLKGAGRPILDEEERSQIVAALSCVDRVVLFDEDTPTGLVEAIRPDVLTKGADYDESEIVGADLVRSWGGRVERIDLVVGKSTTRIVERIHRRLAE